MQLDCLFDYIGLRGACKDVTPPSGIFINDAAGIDAKTLANISSDEQQSFRGVWDEIQRRAIIELEGDVLVRMQRYFKTKTILENVAVGTYLTPYQTESPSAKYKGVAIDLLSSRDMQLFVNSITIYSDTTANTTLKVFDYAAGIQIDSIAISLVAKTYNVININKYYNTFSQHRKIFIAYDATNVTSFETHILGYYENMPRYSILRCGSLGTSSQIIESNIDFDGNSGGIVVSYSLYCSIANLVCSNKDLFKNVLWYKEAQHTMEEILTTKRINQYTMFDEEIAKEYRDEYMRKYVEQLDVVLKNLTPNGDDICFICERTRNYKYSKP